MSTRGAARTSSGPRKRTTRHRQLMVVNRDGDRVPLELDRITQRNLSRCSPILDPQDGTVVARGLPGICPEQLTVEIVGKYRQQFEAGSLRTSLIDALVIDMLVTAGHRNPQNLDLAARLLISNLHHNTAKTFSAAMEAVAAAQPRRLSPEVLAFIRANADELDQVVRDCWDYRFDYAGARTLINSYLIARPNRDAGTGVGRAEGAAEGASEAAGFADALTKTQHGEAVLERPQYCFMRVAAWLGTWFLTCPAGALRASYLGAGGAADAPAEAPEPDTPETRRKFALAFARRIYLALARGEITFGSPFFFNAGAAKARVSSCFLFRVGDSVESIHHTLAQVATASAGGGGNGICWNDVRGAGSFIAGAGGYSTGVPSWWLEYKPVRKYVNQGGNKRPGAIAMYYPFHHPDAKTLLTMPRDSSGLAVEGKNTPDIQTGLCLEGAYFELFERDGRFALLPPEVHPELSRLVGAEWDRRFWELQAHYDCDERRGKVTWIRARDIEEQLYRTVLEKGHPYTFFRDNVAALCNLSLPAADPPLNVNASNLCSEILIPTIAEHPEDAGAPPGETGVCVLGTVNVCEHLFRAPAVCPCALDIIGGCGGAECGCGSEGAPAPDESAPVCPCALYGPRPKATGLDYEGVATSAGLVATALDMAIDLMWFSPYMKSALRSITRHRTIGVGWMGLVGAMRACEIKFASPEGVDFSADAALAVYAGAAEASVRMAAAIGPYPSMLDTVDAAGARVLHSVARGQLQPDVAVAAGFLKADWEARLATREAGSVFTVERLAALRRGMADHGQRNGLLNSGQPTASNSIIHGVTPGGDLPNSLAYTAKTGTARLLVHSREMYDEAWRRGLDPDEVVSHAIDNGGSVSGYAPMPADMRARYLTAYEERPENVLVHAAARQPFVTQAQSTNLNLHQPTMMEIYHLRRLAHKLGLCTLYYVYGKGGNSAMSAAKKAPAPDAPVPDAPAPDAPAPAPASIGGSCPIGLSPEERANCECCES